MLSLSSVLFELLKTSSLPGSVNGATLEKLRSLTTHNPTLLLEMVKSVIPPLELWMHKGQAGRIAVIGGCKEYTGAPYFASISGLKVGADLSHVFCSAGAAPVIKGYSPELIVHPVLDNERAFEDMSEWMPRFHSLVIGPGLGREEHLMKTTTQVIQKAKELQIPMVIDADGLHLITQNPSLVIGCTDVILTPNVAEFSRLYKTVFNKDPDPDNSIINVKQLCRELGHVTIVHKGMLDIMSNGEEVLVCADAGSPRRCGGQGDLLSGSMGVFLYWAKRFADCGSTESLLKIYGHTLCAAYAACILTRECNRLAFTQHGRSMTTSDMIEQIHTAFDKLFS